MQHLVMLLECTVPSKVQCKCCIVVLRPVLAAKPFCKSLVADVLP